MKNIVGRDVLLYYPNFRKKFIIHTDKSNMQLGVIISQNGKNINFSFTPINPAEINYTTTAKEMLSMVVALK